MQDFTPTRKEDVYIYIYIYIYIYEYIYICIYIYIYMKGYGRMAFIVFKTVDIMVCI